MARTVQRIVGIAKTGLVVIRLMDGVVLDARQAGQMRLAKQVTRHKRGLNSISRP